LNRALALFAGTAWVLAACLAAGAACAQSVESEVTPESEHLIKDASNFAIPDISDQSLKKMAIVPEHKKYEIKFGLAVLTDYTTFSQDADSRQQVGIQEDKFEVRSLRVLAHGFFELGRKWNYLASYEYKGFDKNPGDPYWSVTDFNISTLLGPKLGTLTIGKIKEPYSYELAGDSANLPQSERLLNPFFLSRNVGVKLSNTVLNQRGTWSVGWFNDWWVKGDSYSSSGNDFAGRFTFLPILSEDGTTYLHLGAAVRYYGADNNQLRFLGRPGSNVADYYVDTGKVPGDHAWNTGLEALWSGGPYSLLAEYTRSDLSTRDGTSPALDGYYLTGSWVITGEHRPYDKRVGYARRLLPQGRWGSWEVIARYGHVDLDDKTVRGGTMNGWWTGLNWWATRRLKMSIGYGDIDLNRFGIQGNTKTVLSRLQWIY
jgi:phosphate-selective porin OprO and OprP